ncbi:MAG: DUF4190 domain-containing protein [Leucobacter sp.]
MSTTTVDGFSAASNVPEAAVPLEAAPQVAMAPANAQQSPQGYQPPIAAPEADRGNALSVTSFVLGIASIVAGWTFVAPAVGLILGIIALRRNTQERTLALWGVWLNAAMLALSALIAVGIVTVFGLSLVGGAFAGVWS